MTKMSDSPIFIGGSPRSGTTLLGALLGASERTVCVPESQFKTRLVTSPEQLPLSAEALEQAYHRILDDFRFDIWDIDVAVIRRRPEGLDRYADILLWLVGLYGAKSGEVMEGARWVDHTPRNLQDAPVLAGIFPEAKFVHILRDGRAVFNSLQSLDWGPNTATETAKRWMREIAMALAAEQHLDSDAIIQVQYERLVREPREVMKELTDFLGMERAELDLERKGFDVPSYTANQHEIVGKEIDPSRADRWKNTLSKRDIELFEATAGTLLQLLGYRRLFPEGATEAGSIEQLELQIREFVQRRFNRVRYAYRKFRTIE